MRDPHPDGTGRFSDRAADYAAYRPSYPDACIDELLRGVGFPGMLTIADVGAGTGIMARLLADRGSLVAAVEPNAAMRNKAEPHERVLWQDGSAEATGLNDSSVNLLVCAQAFHWFNAPKAFSEFRRVLKGTGRLALVWNEVDNDHPMGAGYREVLDGLATDDSPRVRYAAQEDPFGATDLFDDVRTRSFRFGQPHTAEGLLGRALSASYSPKAGPDLDELTERLASLHAEHADGDGVATLPYVTTSWTAAVKGDEPLVRTEAY